ncbi:MAG: 1,6-anhydro-N-acetylmuramyl-L-alanine amidase AmpD [Hahellaceae bacterium]|nr:1,6-anhydro-N-acetylmuramyl-L-alanine amidase AmpD [Hahellaceae bacterium]
MDDTHHIDAAQFSGWLDAVEMIPSPNFNARPGEGEVSLLVIHNISLPPGQFDGRFVEQFFCNQLDANAHPYFEQIAGLKVSAHFYIRRNGEVVQFVNVFDRAWHAGVSVFNGRKDCNDYSIGIELAGADDMPYTDDQYKSLAELTLQLFSVFPKLVPENIAGHSDIAPGRKSDPGASFDWQRYKRLL